MKHKVFEIVKKMWTKGMSNGSPGRNHVRQVKGMVWKGSEKAAAGCKLHCQKSDGHRYAMDRLNMQARGDRHDDV